MWRPILSKKRFRNLRLNLAHAGTAAAGLCRYRLLDQAELKIGLDRRPEVAYLIHWPPVAGKGWFHTLFPLASFERLRTLVDRIIQIVDFHTDPAPKPSDLPALMFIGAPFVSVARQPGAEAWNSTRAFWTPRDKRMASDELLGALREVLNGQAWKTWMDSFAQSLGSDWLSQCLELAAEYPHVCTDISYFSSDNETLTAVLRLLFKEVFIERENLRRKLIFGTDWFVTESEQVSAWKFWRLVRKVFDDALPGKEECWEDLTSRNALRFLNLGSQFEQWEAFFQQGEGNEGEFLVGLQPWWRNVKRWYERGAESNQGGRERTERTNDPHRR